MLTETSSVLDNVRIAFAAVSATECTVSKFNLIMAGFSHSDDAEVRIRVVSASSNELLLDSETRFRFSLEIFNKQRQDLREIWGTGYRHDLIRPDISPGATSISCQFWE